MTGKQGRVSKPSPYTNEELLAILSNLKQKLGRMPTKKDIPEEIRPLYRKAFGKWCYALEAAGLKIPSAVTLARRARHKNRWKHKKKVISED